MVTIVIVTIVFSTVMQGILEVINFRGLFLNMYQAVFLRYLDWSSVQGSLNSHDEL